MSNPVTAANPATFTALSGHSTALLTTFRRDGRAVATVVGLSVHDGKAYFTTWSTTGKVKRLARNPEVTLAPSTRQGKPIGPTLAGTAQRLEGEALRQVKARGGWLGRIWEGVYRSFLRADAIYYEVTPRIE